VRVVLDTNVVLSATLFEKGRVAWLRDAWTKGTVTPLVDRPCADELLRVLGYPKFKLTRDEIEALLGSYLPHAEIVETSSVNPGRLPRCRDPEDQKFLVLAQNGRAQVLVTGDQALLALAGQTRFTIETPAAFRERLKKRV